MTLELLSILEESGGQEVTDAAQGAFSALLALRRHCSRRALQRALADLRREREFGDLSPGMAEVMRQRARAAERLLQRALDEPNGGRR